MKQQKLGCQNQGKNENKGGREARGGEEGEGCYFDNYPPSCVVTQMKYKWLPPLAVVAQMGSRLSNQASTVTLLSKSTLLAPSCFTSILRVHRFPVKRVPTKLS